MSTPYFKIDKEKYMNGILLILIFLGGPLDPMSKDRHDPGPSALLSCFSGSASHIWVLGSPSSFRPSSTSWVFTLRLKLCLTLTCKGKWAWFLCLERKVRPLGLCSWLLSGWMVTSQNITHISPISLTGTATPRHQRKMVWLYSPVVSMTTSGWHGT